MCHRIRESLAPLRQHAYVTSEFILSVSPYCHEMSGQFLNLSSFFPLEHRAVRATQIEKWATRFRTHGLSSFFSKFDMFLFTVNSSGMLKKREWKYRHDSAGVENAGEEISGGRLFDRM